MPLADFAKHIARRAGWRGRLDIVLQAAKSECGIACLSMILRHYGCHESLAALRQRVNLSISGATLKSIMEAAKLYGLSTRAVRPRLDQLSGLRLPAILHWDFNHYVVLERVTGKRATIIDPNTGRRFLTMAEVSDHYTGIAMELWPASELRPFRNVVAASLFDLWTTASGVRRSALLIGTISLSLQLIILAIPLLLSVVIDSAVAYKSASLLTIVLFAIAGLILLSTSGEILRRFLLLSVGSQVNNQISLNFVNHLVRLPLSFFQQRRLNDVLSRVESIRAIKDTLVEETVPVVVDGVFSVIALTAIFLISPLIGAVVLTSCLTYFALRFLLYPALRARTERALDLSALERGSLMESIRGIETVKALAAEIVRISEWQGANQTATAAVQKQQQLLAVVASVRSAITGSELILVTGVAAFMLLNGSISVGFLFAIVALRQQLQDRLYPLVDRSFQFRLVRMHLDRLADITLAKSTDEGVRRSTLPVIRDGALSVRGVSFRYVSDSDWLIRDLDLEIGAGEFIAIKGRSGGGKTTFARLLLGLLEPEAGQIVVDGTTLGREVMHAYRDDVAAVLQNDQLFGGTLLDNISCFDPDADAQAVVRSAMLAGIHDEIIAMPTGYYSMVGDMGSVLSGGQKQRVLLARALYRNPKILVLDEGTANLDPEREEQIVTLLRTIGITLICIAHRSATLDAADRVFELTGGALKCVTDRRAHLPQRGENLALGSLS